MAVEKNLRFRSLARVWPQGPETLIAEWKNLGFEISESSAKAIEDIKSRWAQFQFPASIECAPQKTSFTYTKLASSKISSDWGFVLCEKAQELDQTNLAIINISHADAAFDYILQKISAPDWAGRSIDVPEEVQTEEGVVVGPGCEFGRGVVLECGVRLGTRVKIGDFTRIGAHSVVGDDTEIGNHCRLKSHVAIGGQGFGLIRYPKDNFARVRKHVGKVIIEDRVNVGSFVAIDRGVLSDTRIGRGTCLDNIVQVAHNCTLGSNNVLCSFVGLSGSTHFGNAVTIAGMVGTKGHLRVGDNVTVAGRSGITSDLPSNVQVKGYPPRPIQEALKIEVLMGKLPELYERLKNLEKAMKKNES
jgi:UDP-3-O-[3-hydroxymyristoyl] glucosamine N-acyltransferase LpxD